MRLAPTRSSHGSSARKDLIHAPVFIAVTRIIAPFAPTRVAPELPEPARLENARGVDRDRMIAVGRDIKCIGGAVELAHETRLAIALARDDGRVIRREVEHIGRANLFDLGPDHMHVIARQSDRSEKNTYEIQ